MTPQEIINEAQLLGVRIILNPSGGLSLVGNTSVVTESFKATVTENRQQIIDYLKANAPLPAGINPEVQPTKKYVVGQNNMVFFAVTGPTSFGPRPSFGLTSNDPNVKFPADLYPPISSPLKRTGLSGGSTPANLVNTFNGGTGNITFTVNGSTGSNVTGATMFNIEVVNTFNGATGTVEGVNTFNGATGTIEGVNTFNGATGSIVGVNSVNGQTGAVTLVDLIGVSTVNGVSGDVQVVSSLNGATGVVEAVTSFNGNTGAVEGVSSVNGGTGSVAAVNTFNGVAGAVEGVNTFNGNTGAIEGVNTFNGNTGTIEGVASVNGATGAVTNIAAINATNLFSSNQEFAGSVAVSGGMSLQTSGITFPDGTHQPTAARSGFRYQSVSSGGGLGTPSSGFIDIDTLSELDTMTINNTDKEGNDLEPLFQELRDNGGYLEVSNGDFSQVFAATIVSQADDDNTVTTGETTIVVGSTTTQIQNTNLIEQGLDQQNITDIYLRIVPNAASYVRTNATNLFTSNQEFQGSVAVSGGISMQTSGITFPDGTHQNTAASSSKQVAHFTIQASSGIAANEKLDALKFVPENSTVTEVGLKTSITGGVTASFVQAGTDPFGAATTGARTLATIELGQTGNDFGFTSSTIASSAITGGSFVYLDVTSISGGITGLQAFMTFEGA